MKLPTIDDVELNLKNCLLLKSDDIYFTLNEEEGSRLRNEFIGIDIEGLADENVSLSDFSLIDLTRFAIYCRIKLLYEILEGRSLSGDKPSVPDSESARLNGLEFLEYFLSTLPSTAMGGFDLTGAAFGEVKDVYSLAYAWLNLVDAISGAFNGETECELTISDLSLLSGLDRRTVHNRCGPAKEIRTTVGRYAQPDRKAVDPAFVTVHPFDAIAWLCSRPSFTITPIEKSWIEKRFLENANQRGFETTVRTRGALVAALVNGLKYKDMQASLGVSSDQCKKWYDTGGEIPKDHRAKLAEILGVTLG